MAVTVVALVAVPWVQFRALAFETHATVAVDNIAIESVESFAVKIALPGVIDVTVNITCPVELDGPEAAEIVSNDPDRLDVSETVFPEIGAELVASTRVTVIDAVVTPSARSATEVGKTVLAGETIGGKTNFLSIVPMTVSSILPTGSRHALRLRERTNAETLAANKLPKIREAAPIFSFKKLNSFTNVPQFSAQ